MTDFLFFIFYFYFLLFSVIGYGIFFENVCFKNINAFNFKASIYTGFYGLFSITLLSLITSIFVPHNFIHNLILHLTGIIFFIFLKFENKKKYIKYILFISIVVFSALLISKTNDDLSYYHLPFTKYLTENKIIFGLGNLNHGYNLLSSLFFLNSTFFLPFIEYYSFHFSLIYFLIFFNFFIVNEIFSKKIHSITKFLYLFSFTFFNISFNRLAEFGTDKPGQLLIVILIIKLFQILCFEKENNRTEKILYLLPLLALCISLKTYFLPYTLLGLTILLLNNKILNTFRFIFYSKSFLFFLFLILFYFFHHFVSTGCLISPLPATCFSDYFEWARQEKEMVNLSIWLEQWAKAGAGPDFRVENVSEYIQNFNWLTNWIDKYFFNKLLDQTAILFSTFLLILFLFKKLSTGNFEMNFQKKLFFFYFLLLIIFYIWFFNHPTLRYGGYSIGFLILSIPFAILFQKFYDRDNFIQKFKFLIIFVIIIFNIKNITRIEKELTRNDFFKYTNFPYFKIKEKNYKANKFDAGLTIYSAHHCWSTPTPCGHVDEKIYVTKKNGYYFINKIR